MKILITGNAGFIGGHLTKALLGAEHGVVGLDKRPASRAPAEVNCHLGNILDEQAVMEAMEGCEMVIHLAAEHQDWGITREEYFEVNQVGTRTLLECASKLKITKFVFYSSVAVYGSSMVPTSENTTPVPDNDYGHSKLAAEAEVEKWVAKTPKNSGLVIRPTVVFGPEMNDYSNLFRLVDQIAKNRFLYIGKMSNTKSVAYVENLVGATLYLMGRMKPGVQYYNYTEYEHMTSRAIAANIAKSLGVWLPPITLPYKSALAAATLLDVVANITKINLPITAARIAKVNTPTYHRSDKLRLDGFVPHYSMEESLSKTCSWYLNRDEI